MYSSSWHFHAAAEVKALQLAYTFPIAHFYIISQTWGRQCNYSSRSRGAGALTTILGAWARTCSVSTFSLSRRVRRRNGHLTCGVIRPRSLSSRRYRRPLSDVRREWSRHLRSRPRRTWLRYMRVTGHPVYQSAWRLRRIYREKLIVAGVVWTMRCRQYGMTLDISHGPFYEAFSFFLMKKEREEKCFKRLCRHEA